MTDYEKIISVMRKEGAKKNERGVRLAEMTEDFGVKAGELSLEKDDLVFAEHLITGYKDKDGNSIRPVGKGDSVLIKRLSDEKYAVIERVISIA